MSQPRSHQKNFWVSVLLLPLLGCHAQTAALPGQPSDVGTAPRVFASDQVSGSIAVDFRDGTTQEQIDIWEKEWSIDLTYNSREEGPHSGIAIAVGIAPEAEAGLLARIRQNPAVESAEPLLNVRASFVPNDPDFPKQWNLKAIDMPAAWEGNHGKGVIVAVVDTGIAYEDHEEFRRVPDLQGTAFAPGYDFVNDTSHPNDDQGHGTHVAGTIAQATNNGLGVAGIAFEATLMPIKVLNHFGSGVSTDIADGIRWAADHGAKVINLSLGGGSRSEVMEAAVRYARAKGALVVCAAGNGGIARVEYPAAYPEAFAVSAVGPTGELAPYSSFGPELDLAAPGGDKRGGDEGGILQNTIDPRDPSRSIYASYQGTSMATPHVSAVAALLFAAGAEGPDQVEAALLAGARPAPGQHGWTARYGHGLLDARGALEALAQGATKPVKAGPLLWAAGLLAVVLLSIGKRDRRAYFNVLLQPRVLIPLVLSTGALFFLHRNPSGGALNFLSTPLPDWWEIIIGRTRRVNPLFYSAAVPLLIALPAIGARWLRPIVAGLALGYAGFLAHAAWSGAPALSYLPFRFLSLSWLIVNAVACALLARAMLRKERA